MLREDRQDYPNHRQNSSPFSLCCCIIIDSELDNFLLYFSPPADTLSDHLTGHPSPSLVRICDTHISSQVSIHVSPAEEGQIHHHQQHTVVVCHWRHFLIAIVIITSINKIINHHNQCIRCQSFVQPSTHDIASPVSSYIFLEKGKKTTRKFRKSFNRIKVVSPLFSPSFFAVLTHA